METIQIVLEEDLLKAADREAKRLRTNRSSLFRTALREHLKRTRLKKDEDLERAAYAAMPEGGEMAAFEKVAHNLLTVRKDQLGRRVARLSEARNALGL